MGYQRGVRRDTVGYQIGPFALYLRIARETFCFHGLSFLIPIPNPERKKSSPVVTRSHFCDASNSNTALSQMKA